MGKAMLLGAGLAALMSAASALAQDEVSFADVMANPGDLSLNLTYAEQRINEGDLLPAAATLERLLFAEPNWHEARVLYANVLYRLGDYAAAKREIDVLKGQDLSPEVAAEVAKYSKQIDPTQNRTRISGYLSGGLGYDTDARTLIQEDVDGLFISTSEDQASFIASGRIGVEHSLSEGRDLSLFASIDGYLKKFEDDELDGFSILNAQAGIKGAGTLLDWKAGIGGRQVKVQGENYLTEFGGEISGFHDFGARTSAGAVFSYYDQEYEPIFGGFGFGDARSGDRFDVTALLRHACSSRFHGSFGLSYRDKSADDPEFGYEFMGVQLGGDVFYRSGVYLDTDIIYRDYSYDGGYGFFGPTRDDELTYGRFAVGVPLSVIAGGDATGPANPLTVELGVTHTIRNSNLSFFEYDNTGAELRLVWRFGQ